MPRYSVIKGSSSWRKKARVYYYTHRLNNRRPTRGRKLQMIFNFVRRVYVFIKHPSYAGTNQ
jgi:hypothetical protein